MTSETELGAPRTSSSGTDGDAHWYLASTVDERREAGAPHGPVDTERAGLRMRMWQAEPILAAEDSRLDDYLAILGVDRDGMLELLGETPESVRSRFSEPPDYLATIERVYGAAAREGVPSGRLPGQSKLTFAELAGPLVADGAERIADAVGTLLAQQPSEHLVGETLIEQLSAPPFAAIASVLDKTLVLEMNILRVQGELAGDDPHHRFHNYIDRLHDPAYALALLREYPVLARDLVRVVANWVLVRTEFAAHLIADLPDVLGLLGTGEGQPGAVRTIGFGAGDSHRGGRSVATVEFAGGHKVIYKPRSLAVERHFQELLDWLNERGAQPPLRTITVLDRGGYGWSEYVRARPCADRDGVARFYRRQGMLLAVLHALTAIDFHWENLIADGEHPMLVDLEALFHPAQNVPESPYVPAPAQAAVSESVLAVGLLPRPSVWHEDDEVEGIDMSGLAGGEGQKTPMKVPTWDDLGTDHMRLVRKRQEMPHWSNRPAIGEQTANALEFRDEILAGYADTYRLFVSESDGLLDTDGPIHAFADDEIRVLLRATRIYARILQEGHHPDLMRDALDRQRFYGCLSLLEPWPEHRAALSAAELRQIQCGDIPMFTTTPGSVDLIAGDDDGSVIRDVLPLSGLRRSLQRIASFGEEHLRQQLWFVEGSLTALAMGDAGALKPAADLPLATGPARDEQYLEAAVAVADDLLDDAIVADDRIAWLGLTLVADRVWTLGSTPNDLFNGIPGIALFLGYLAELTGEARYADAAHATANTLLRQAELFDDVTGEQWESISVGGFNELGGPVYALSHLATVLGRDELAAAANRLCAHLPPLVTQDRALDLMSGSAGAIMALLACHAVTGDDSLLATAAEFGEHLAGQAIETDGGLAWDGSLDPGVALAGMSHGASGIALALSRLDTARGQARHREIVDAACAYERSIFDESRGNWPDLRTLTAGSGSMLAWCHGAPGIGLARAELLGYLHRAGGRTDGVRGDLERAAAAMLAARGTGGVTSIGNHSLCHGDLGNAECLIAVADALENPELRADAERVSATVLADGLRGGWACGVPLGVSTPGLMTGRAGIGYWLLRRAAAGRVPSVLAVEPPRPPRPA